MDKDLMKKAKIALAVLGKRSIGGFIIDYISANIYTF